VAAELSYHWQAAGDLERALPAAIEAGTQAGCAFAFAEARRHYEQVLELWPRVPRAAQLAPIDQVGLLERAAEAAHLVGDHPRAVELLREALREVDADTDPVRAGLLQERLGRYLWLSVDQAALRAYEEAVRLVPAEPPSVERARVLAGYAQILGLLGKDEQCRQAAEEALAAARRAGARREEGRALGLVGGVRRHLGSCCSCFGPVSSTRSPTLTPPGQRCRPRRLRTKPFWASRCSHPRSRHQLRRGPPRSAPTPPLGHCQPAHAPKQTPPRPQHLP
jgi:tetratricopeptide (TPR) repeat protein